MGRVDIIEQLAVPGTSRILLVVLDGLGGVPRDSKTELEAAWSPNLDHLAARSSTGLTVPVARGVTPGSGPAHLALFGYDPLEYQVGRGILEALGVGLTPGPGDLCARANFATLDGKGKVKDRRAGRISTEECERLCGRLSEELSSIEDMELKIVAGREHRFVVVFKGEGLADGLTDSDPQHSGVAPLEVQSTREEAAKSAKVVNAFGDRCREVLEDEDRANCVLLRGLSLPPKLTGFGERYRLNAACIASYPMYRGLARLVGMEVLETGNSWSDEVKVLQENRDRFDFFYLHLKDTDKAGEDGEFDRKVELIERFDEEILPLLTKAGFEVLCITGDHSTPAVLKAHSWHSVPFLLHSPYVRPHIQVEDFGERSCARGNLGMFPAKEVMGLLLAHAGRLRKFGA